MGSRQTRRQTFYIKSLIWIWWADLLAWNLKEGTLPQSLPHLSAKFKSLWLKYHSWVEALCWAAWMRLKGSFSNGRVMGRGSEGGNHATERREADEVRGWQVRWSIKGCRWVISGSQRRMECGPNRRERDWSVKHERKVLVWERTSEHTLHRREEPRGEMVINLVNAVTV